ncbi:hypothetical protein ACIBBG_31970 [Micromonospora chersina]|uniref:hypothetical protein n=1 Tax=Micromonospora chersina TaxID=47854 RepID=UPI0037A4C774
MAYDAWRFEVSSADPDAAVPVWVNLTSRVRTTGSGQRAVQIRRGAGSERDDVQPSTLSATLENTDHALTPGNPSSPYVAWWGQRRKCRLVETVLGVDYIRFTGYTNPLDLPDWAEPGIEQLVTLTAVDWLGRLDTAPALTSTLQEHIRTQGGPLVEHFPLSDPYPQTSAVTLAATRRTIVGFQTSAATEPEQLIQAAALPGPPGDDQSYARWVPLSDGTLELAKARLSAKLNVSFGATDVIALSVWLCAQTDPNGYDWASVVVALTSPGPRGFLVTDNGFAGSIQGTWRSPVLDTDLNAGRRLEKDVWRLLTVRLDAGTGALDFWLGADVAQSATVTPPGATTLTDLSIGTTYAGGVGQLQIRVGPPATTMTRAMHLAQYAHGYRGLERQSAGERVTTIAGYAGVPAADLAVDAAAATPMQRARLSRARPTAALRAAATTEAGRLFVTGPGKIRLRARAARYDQPVALQIPYRWVRRGLRFKEDSPINDVTASLTGGGSTRRTDAASIQRYGVGDGSVTLDTAVDADLGNRAAWTVAAYATPRMRCPQLVIDLLPLTDAQRASLLALEIGDRIEVTGGPATIPPDARHLIIEGFWPDEIGAETRRLTLNTSPLLGPSTGTPPTSVMVGDLVADTAVITY